MGRLVVYYGLEVEAQVFVAHKVGNVAVRLALARGEDETPDHVVMVLIGGVFFACGVGFVGFVLGGAVLGRR